MSDRKSTHRFNVLVCPLNWGLGHAARCIPIILALQKRECYVIAAADGNAFELLKSELPELEVIRLKDVQISYGKNGMGVAGLATKIPAAIKVLHNEHDEVSKIVATRNIHGIISDNRYGCFDMRIVSVIITHQLQPIVPPLFKPFQTTVHKWITKRLKQFDQIWVPDIPHQAGLTGKLSTNTADLPKREIGILSRLVLESEASAKVKLDAVAILGGPEPQRTEFEKLMLSQMAALPQYKFVILRGLPAHHAANPSIHTNVQLIAHADTQEFSNIVMSARCVIARSGYSSIMDLIRLQKSACLVPTPRQTEQEYLAHRMESLRYFTTQSQSAFSLDHALESTTLHAPPPLSQIDDHLSSAIDEFITTMAQRTAINENLNTFVPDLGSTQKD